MKHKSRWIFILFFLFVNTALFTQAEKSPTPSKEEMLLDAMHSISSHSLFDYIKEMCSEKYTGRLTGTEGYNKSADWVSKFMNKWGVKPGGDNDTYFQDFPNPYTLVFEGSKAILHIPYKRNVSINKHYQFQTDFLPGSTSGTGKVKAEVVYVGYGITAPELNFDEYKGLNVKGKIVLVETEVPVSPSKEPEEFKKWRSYSFHQYKVENAKAHGAAGMIYYYHIANPNCKYIEDLILTYIGKPIVEDIFLGTRKVHKKVKDKIIKTRKPQSFRTRKQMTIENITKHHPEGIARNVLGYIEGSDPILKKDVIAIGGHLDHLGLNHLMMPGANDNASGIAVMLGIAKAINKSGLKPKRSILFTFFGAEEQGVKGSEYFLKNPTLPDHKIISYINLDGVGRGTKIFGLAGKNYPKLWNYFETANKKYIHRILKSSSFHNRARPRLDAAHFMWSNIPSISFSSYGAEKLPYAIYHKTLDNPDIITPEIMEDLAQLIFLSVMELAQSSDPV
jgi:hypothetical protein